MRGYENQARIDNKTILQLYADDAVIAALDHTVAQYTLDVLSTNFKRFWTACQYHQDIVHDSTLYQTCTSHIRFTL
jgi:hypothetical protein